MTDEQGVPNSWLAEYNDSIELIYVGGLRNFSVNRL